MARNKRSSEEEQHRTDDDERITYHRPFDPETDSVSQELIDAVATINNADPTEMEILAQFIDPDALDSLFQSRPEGSSRDVNGEIRFEYDTFTVIIDSDGIISLNRRDEQE